MRIISHRRNTAELLKQTPREFGVEIDIRSRGSKLILQHDPFVKGEFFEEWLRHFEHGTLILNVKEEGLEQAVTNLMRKRGISDFFFLDQSFPFLVKTAASGESRCAVRVSEYESIDTALTLAGKIDWVWVDCFTRFPLSREQAARLVDSGLRLCLVSPELQGRDPAQEVPDLRRFLEKIDVKVGAVCTKRPELWGA